MNAPRERFALEELEGLPISSQVPLRVMTAGSVDDGKSTLIGRLMHDLDLITDDVLEDLRAASRKNGRGELDLSLYTDGLIAEREQGITIDVAYRYFRHRDRSFILCDSPGHEQFTRNMVCAASQADVALIMIDAKAGPTRQSLRHLRIAQWLRVPKIVFVINKMDRVGFSQARYLEIVAGLQETLKNRPDKSNVADDGERQANGSYSFVPVVALDGDHIVHSNHDPMRLGWYRGPSILQSLEQASAQQAIQLDAPLRFTVQTVLRPTGKQLASDLGEDLHDFRAFAGRVESGSLRVGQSIYCYDMDGVARETQVLAIHHFDGDKQHAQAGESVSLSLRDDLDLGRGDVIADAVQDCIFTKQIEAEICWMSEITGKVGQRVLVKQGTRSTIAKIAAIQDKLDIEQGQFYPIDPAQAAQGQIILNEVVRVTLVVAQALLLDSYGLLPRTASLLILDPLSFDTLGAGIIV